MKKIIVLFLVVASFVQCKTSEEILVSQTEKKSNQKDSVKIIKTQPKLVVGIVVDQMRYDYLTRFWGRFGNGGFKRLVNKGYHFKNNHYNYVPTYTAPGHASIYTGTTPKNHGIISNDWYNKFEKHQVYCTEDESVSPVGTSSAAGKMSPHRMKTTSFTDELRLHSQFKGKVIGVAIKDRSSILPAGHTANAAYWFHGKDEGRFVSSSHYMESLPQWVQDFNNSDKIKSYLKTWNSLYPIETYTESGGDQNDFEQGFKGKAITTFPYDLANLSEENGGLDIIKYTPFGNSLTTDFALETLKNEQMGQDEITDVLALSYSCTDYVGHNFGVNSKELEDTYLRLDQDLERLLSELDASVGEGEYTIFLTSDHGAVYVPAYLKSKKIPAGYFNADELKNNLNEFLGEEYGVVDLIENMYNNQLFLNYDRLKEENINRNDLAEELKEFLLKQAHIDKAFTRKMLENGTYTNGVPALVQNGFNQKRSGDVVYVFDPSYIISYYTKGTTHGSAMSYDTHSPLIFFGKGIKNGQTTERTEITDIAPTISALLGIAFPNGSTGNVLFKMLDED
jgi:predicted AlkP superfamily pyrophosphatase or phosphodiesterase